MHGKCTNTHAFRLGGRAHSLPLTGNNLLTDSMLRQVSFNTCLFVLLPLQYCMPREQ